MTWRLPPDDGWWLAAASARGEPAEYSCQLTAAASHALDSAASFVESMTSRREVEPLLTAYKKWRRMPPAVAGFTRLGPLDGGPVEKSLVAFLLAWRMTLDQLANSISAEFGKNSMQWDALQQSRRATYDKYLGYAVVEAMRNIVQHSMPPPLVHTIERTPVPCTECGGKHDELDLSVTLSVKWLYDHCDKRPLRDRLLQLGADSVDVRKVVEDAVEGFHDILFCLLCANEGDDGHLRALAHAFATTAPAMPLLIEFSNGKISLRKLESTAWAAVRRSRDP